MLTLKCDIAHSNMTKQNLLLSFHGSEADLRIEILRIRMSNFSIGFPLFSCLFKICLNTVKRAWLFILERCFQKSIEDL